MLSRLQTYLIGAALIVLAGLWFMLGRANDRAAKAEAKAAAATRQAEVSDATTKAVDQVLRTEVIIRDRTEKAADAVQSAPGADAPVPVDVLAAWRAGINELRAPGASPEGDGS